MAFKYRKFAKPQRPVAPEGEHDLTIMAITEKTSSSGNHMLELKLRVEPQGPIVFDHLVLTDRSGWKLNAFFAALGEDPVEGEDLELEDFAGRYIRAVLGVEEYDGRNRNIVKKWLPAKGNVT